MPGIEIVNCGDEMENNVPITDIADLLFQQFVVISGKCIELYLILCKTLHQYHILTVEYF